MQKHEGHPLENLQSCENRVCNPQRGICTKEDNVISKCIFVKLQLKMQLLRVIFQNVALRGSYVTVTKNMEKHMFLAHDK